MHRHLAIIASLAFIVPAAAQEVTPVDTIRSIVLTEEMVVEGLGLPPADEHAAETPLREARCSGGSMAVVCTASLDTGDRGECRRRSIAMNFEAHFNAPPEWPRDRLMVTLTCEGHTTVAFSTWESRSVWFAVNTRPGLDGAEVEARELVVLHEEDPADADEAS